MDADVIVSQLRASLSMLRDAIAVCPEHLWDRPSDHNRFWAIAYHAIFFAHLYLSPSEEEFVPWERRVQGKEGFGRTHLGDWSKLTSEDAYGKEDVLAYCDYVRSIVSELVSSAPLDGPSGFSWLPFSRGEAHLYNLRHIQHHAGQLAERLRQSEGIGSRWASAG